MQTKPIAFLQFVNRSVFTILVIFFSDTWIGLCQKAIYMKADKSLCLWYLFRFFDGSLFHWWVFENYWQNAIYMPGNWEKSSSFLFSSILFSSQTQSCRCIVFWMYSICMYEAFIVCARFTQRNWIWSKHCGLWNWISPMAVEQRDYGSTATVAISVKIYWTQEYC